MSFDLFVPPPSHSDDIEIPREPRLPSHLMKNQRKLTQTQIAEAKDMLANNSQRFVAEHFGVSRHTILMHCIDGYAQKFRQKYPHVASSTERRNESLRKRRALKKKLYPTEMKAVQQATNAKYRGL